jgi:DNA-binding transcriptional regulator YhcF (GntR family)
LNAEIEIKLLELTKDGRMTSTQELANHLHIEVDKLSNKIRELSRNKAIFSSRGIVEMSAEQRIMLSERLIHEGRDPQQISRLLQWQEFEEFASHSLEQNDFRKVKHVVFKSRIGRREIDLLAWNDTFLLAIDCKHWLRGLSPSRAREVAIAQTERAQVLAERLELLKKHIPINVEKRRLLPVILCLGCPREAIVEGVPIVAVSKLISFLYGLSPIDERLKWVPVRPQSGQSILL